MKKTSVTLILCLMLITLTGADIVIKRDRSVMRKGPGSYYEVLKELALNTRLQLLSQNENWYNVAYDMEKGFVAVSATQPQPPRRDIFSGMKAKPGSKVTQHSISAGVKGFASQFNRQFKGNDDFVTYAMDLSLDPEAYDSFIDATYQIAKQQAYRKALPLPEREEPDYYAEAAEGFGLALASVIAEQGLFDKPVWLDYLNQVGNNLVSCSDVPDISFKFFILDLDAPNAYACPGGYVFVTRGMLRLLDSEADLAFILAHEIAHVSRFHGIKEARLQTNQIAAESVFDELDADTAGFSTEGNADAEAELEEDLNVMFNDLISGRLDKYEIEADSLAMYYTARAGYETRSVNDIFSRLYASQSVSNNEHYRKDSLLERSEAIDAGFPQNRGIDLKFFSHRERWQKMRGQL